MGKALEQMSREELEETLPEASDVIGRMGIDNAQRREDEAHFIRLAEAQEPGKTGMNSNPRYSAFYEHWQKFHVNERDYEADTDRKTKGLLIFPKFTRKGLQPITYYSPSQIGALYVRMLEQTKKILGQ